MKTTIPERVALIMKELDVDQVGLSAIAGTTKSVVNQWLSGKIKSIAAEYAYSIQRKKFYSAEWIQTGNGDKHLKDYALDEDQRTLIEAFPLLEDGVKAIWLLSARSALEKAEAIKRNVA